MFGSPLTLYRVIQAGVQPDVIAAGNVTALGVGESGGTTYKQVEFFTMLSASSPDAHPLKMPSLPIVTRTRTGTSVVVRIFDDGFSELFQSEVFVEADSWVYKSFANAGGEFNGWEENCTLPDAGGKGIECVNIQRMYVANTVSAGTTTYSGSAMPRFTADGPIPTSAGSQASALSWCNLVVIVGSILLLQ